jgi:hypothetical protein
MTHLAWNVHSIGLRLETKSEHVLRSFRCGQFQLLVAHFAKFCGFHFRLDHLDNMTKLCWTTTNQANRDRHLGCKTCKAHLGLLFRYTGELIKNRAWSNHSYPVFRLPLAFTHSGFQRLGGNWFIWKYSDVKSTFATNVLVGRDSSRFDCLGSDPATL